MPPKPLRQATRKAAVALPQNAKFTFLADASKAVASVDPGLASALGSLALKVGEGPHPEGGAPPEASRPPC